MIKIALTFDHWLDAYTIAYPEMNARGLAGTYFVDHRCINNTDVNGIDQPTAFNIGLTRDHLTKLKMSGWTIGAYSGDNMVDKFSYDRNQAMDFLRDIKSGFEVHGFEVETLAPNQRAWDNRLRNISVELFERVRVANVDTVQPLPLRDPLYIAGGGIPSLDQDQTPEKIKQRFDMIRAGGDGLWIFTVHKIGIGPYCVSPAAFAALLDQMQAMQQQGWGKAIGMDELS